MLDPSTEADLLRSLTDAYQEILNETARGKLGGQGGDTMKGARAAQGGGRLGVFTPARGMGANKAIKNNPKADDKRAARQKAQAKADRAEAARDRRAAGEDKVQRKIIDVQNYPGQYGLKGVDKDGDGKVKVTDH
jgi:hypothetical protein